MGKVSKSTKKFQSKHLKHTLDHRKEVQKHNKLKGKKKSSDRDAPVEPKKADKGELFDDMSVEDFFAKDADIAGGKKNKKSSKLVQESEDESSSEEEFEQDMGKLQEQDPEFYKYLQENDKGLLDFKPENPLDAMSDSDSDNEDNVKVDEEYDEEPEITRIEVTLKLVSTWEKNLASTKPDYKALKSVAMAFKSAVHIDSDSEEYKYSVTDEKAFNRLMILALKGLPKAVQTLLPYSTNKNSVRSLPSSKQNAKKLTTVSSILKSHAGSLITLLNDITNTETAALVLTSIQEILPYYLSQRKLIKKMLSKIVSVWATTKEVETQIATFAFLNNAAREFPKSILETVLKLTYSTFIKNSRATNVHTEANINFQKNSAVELFGIDEALSYQIGFEFIRQLAIHLRNSTNNPTKDSHKIIYNWQYCHSLDFWSRVLSKYCNVSNLANKKESPLKELIYPLVQVTIGTIKLLPSAQFFPLRFYLIRSLIRVSQNSDVYIPVFPLLSEILTSTAFTKSPKPHGKSSQPLQAVDFEHNIKVNAAYLNTRIYQDGLCEQFVELVGEFFGLYAKSISYPELCTPPVILLRRYMKQSKNPKFNKQLSNLIEKLNANSKFIFEQRSNVEFGPNNRTEVNRFLNDYEWKLTPLGKYLTIQREVQAEKTRLLRESMLEDEEERKNSKAKNTEDIDIASDSEEDSDEEMTDEE